MDSLKRKKNFMGLSSRLCAEQDYDIGIAATIIELRLQRKMTQSQLARKLKTKQPAIARMENGDYPVSHKMLKRIARILNADLRPPKLIPLGDL